MTFVLVTFIHIRNISTVIDQLLMKLEREREIVCSGIKGWKARSRKRKRNNQKFYRLAKDTMKERMKKELLEKENWFKSRKDEEE